MALTTAQLTSAWHDAQKETVSLSAWSKTDLQAVATAIDTWIDTNQASFNAALPVNFQGVNSTAAQKAVMFMWVLIRRLRG